MITQGSLLEVMQSGLESHAARNQAGPLIRRLNNYEPQHNSPAYVHQMKAGPSSSHTSRPPTRSHGSGFTCQLCTIPPFANREDLIKHMNSKHQSPGPTKARKRSNDGYMNTLLGVSQQRGAY
ncbi:hypothetical protein BDZ89DRAFT_1061589 [Hymenopellis radicata]|nr:hypothetical protein BDZ89DRAFT_1061589 [Hymenopellis radicata]